MMHRSEDEEPRKRTIAVSGGFDPIHPGHVRYIREASLYADVIAILNTDEWLLRKKGYVFQSYEARAEILGSIAGVVGVYPAEDKDGTVCKSLATLLPDFFANGGDRGAENTPEATLCKNLGIKLVYNCGGGKIASSSELVNAHRS